MIIIMLSVGDRERERKALTGSRREQSLPAGDGLGGNDPEGPQEQAGAWGRVKEGRPHKEGTFGPGLKR